jgi:hypothetical protein
VWQLPQLPQLRHFPGGHDIGGVGGNDSGGGGDLVMMSLILPMSQN